MDHSCGDRKLIDTIVRGYFLMSVLQVYPKLEDRAPVG